MTKDQLKNKYNEFYKEYKNKEWYQLSQFDKLFVVLLDIANKSNTATTTDVISNSLDIVFNNGYCSNNFTLPSTDCLLINPKLDKDVTINFQILYKDIFIETDLYIDIPKNVQLVLSGFAKFKPMINKENNCRLCSNQVINDNFLMYYV